MSWETRPALFEYWDEEYDCVMAIDENGTTDLQGLKKDLIRRLFSSSTADKTEIIDHDRWFTITGVIMTRDNFPGFRNEITALKERYWEDGLFEYKSGLKRVVFHSREIRKKMGPFNPRIINVQRFLSELSEFIEQTECVIFSSTIDKLEHIRRYINPYHVYELCLEFIIERFCMYLNDRRKTGIVLLESRGKKEDREILNFISKFLKRGNKYNSPDQLACIKGVYFNPKWQTSSNGKLSYPLLELADLISYPINKFCKYGTKDQAFEIVEKKLFYYPHYSGYGLKTFPKK